MKWLAYGLLSSLGLLSGLMTTQTTPSLDGAAEVVAKMSGLKPAVGIFVEGPDSTLRQLFSSALSRSLARKQLTPTPVAAKTADDAEVQARGLGLQTLIRVKVWVENGHLRVLGDFISTHVNFWSGRMPTRAGPAGAISVAVLIDESLRTAVPLTNANASTSPGTVAAPNTTPSTPQYRQVHLAKFAKRIAALTAADLNQDGRSEFVVLFEDELLLVDADGRTIGRLPLSGNRATSTCREPMGLALVQNNPLRLLVWSAAREKPEAFSLTPFRSLGPIDEISSEGTSYRLDLGSNRFRVEGKLGSVTKLTQLVRKNGVQLSVKDDGSALIQRANGQSKSLLGVGSGSTLIDADGAGDVTLFVSNHSSTGDNDTFRWLSLKELERQTEVASPAKDVVALHEVNSDQGRALFAQPIKLDAEGAEDVLVGLWNENGGSRLVALRRAQP